MKVTAIKADNLLKAAAMVASARNDHKADIAVLPECFSCPYGTKFFPQYCEPLPPVGSNAADITAQTDKFPAASCLSKAALDNKIWIVGGSVPEMVPPSPEGKAESSGEKPVIYNSSMVFSPDGVLRAVHRKIHLFKINTETVKMDEAEVLTAGNTPTVVDVAPHAAAAAAATVDGDDPRPPHHPSFKMGVGICFDIRFPQLAMYYHGAGTSFLCYPGAFNMVTGPAHWLLAAKSRAIDTQQFVAVCSVARDTEAGYVAYGHSAIVDMWGDVLCEAKEGEEIVAADLDMTRLAEVRSKLPISTGTRNDLYALQWGK